MFAPLKDFLEILELQASVTEGSVDKDALESVLDPVAVFKEAADAGATLTDITTFVEELKSAKVHKESQTSLVTKDALGHLVSCAWKARRQVSAAGAVPSSGAESVPSHGTHAVIDNQANSNRPSHGLSVPAGGASAPQLAVAHSIQNACGDSCKNASRSLAAEPAAIAPKPPSTVSKPIRSLKAAAAGTVQACRTRPLGTSASIGLSTPVAAAAATKCTQQTDQHSRGSESQEREVFTVLDGVAVPVDSTQTLQRCRLCQGIFQASHTGMRKGCCQLCNRLRSRAEKARISFYDLQELLLEGTLEDQHPELFIAKPNQLPCSRVISPHACLTLAGENVPPHDSCNAAAAVNQTQQPYVGQQEEPENTAVVEATIEQLRQAPAAATPEQPVVPDTRAKTSAELHACKHENAETGYVKGELVKHEPIEVQTAPEPTAFLGAQCTRLADGANTQPLANPATPADAPTAVLQATVASSSAAVAPETEFGIESVVPSQSVMPDPESTTSSELHKAGAPKIESTSPATTIVRRGPRKRSLQALAAELAGIQHEERISEPAETGGSPPPEAPETRLVPVDVFRVVDGIAVPLDSRHKLRRCTLCMGINIQEDFQVKKYSNCGNPAFGGYCSACVRLKARAQRKSLPVDYIRQLLIAGTLEQKHPLILTKHMKPVTTTISPHAHIKLPEENLQGQAYMHEYKLVQERIVDGQEAAGNAVKASEVHCTPNGDATLAEQALASSQQQQLCTDADAHAAHASRGHVTGTAAAPSETALPVLRVEDDEDLVEEGLKQCSFCGVFCRIEDMSQRKGTAANPSRCRCHPCERLIRRSELVGYTSHWVREKLLEGCIHTYTELFQNLKPGKPVTDCLAPEGGTRHARRLAQHVALVANEREVARRGEVNPHDQSDDQKALRYSPLTTRHAGVNNASQSQERSTPLPTARSADVERDASNSVTATVSLQNPEGRMSAAHDLEEAQVPTNPVSAAPHAHSPGQASLEPVSKATHLPPGIPPHPKSSHGVHIASRILSSSFVERPCCYHTNSTTPSHVPSSTAQHDSTPAAVSEHDAVREAWMLSNASDAGCMAHMHGTDGLSEQAHEKAEPEESSDGEIFSEEEQEEGEESAAVECSDGARVGASSPPIAALDATPAHVCSAEQQSQELSEQRVVNCADRQQNSEPGSQKRNLRLRQCVSPFDPHPPPPTAYTTSPIRPSFKRKLVTAHSTKRGRKDNPPAVDAGANFSQAQDSEKVESTLQRQAACPMTPARLSTRDLRDSMQSTHQQLDADNHAFNENAPMQRDSEHTLQHNRMLQEPSSAVSLQNAASARTHSKGEARHSRIVFVEPPQQYNTLSSTQHPSAAPQRHRRSKQPRSQHPPPGMQQEEYDEEDCYHSDDPYHQNAQPAQNLPQFDTAMQHHHTVQPISYHPLSESYPMCAPQQQLIHPSYAAQPSPLPYAMRQNAAASMPLHTPSMCAPPRSVAEWNALQQQQTQKSEHARYFPAPQPGYQHTTEISSDCLALEQTVASKVYSYLDNMSQPHAALAAPIHAQERSLSAERQHIAVPMHDGHASSADGIWDQSREARSVLNADWNLPQHAPVQLSPRASKLRSQAASKVILRPGKRGRDRMKSLRTTGSSPAPQQRKVTHGTYGDEQGPAVDVNEELVTFGVKAKMPSHPKSATEDMRRCAHSIYKYLEWIERPCQKMELGRHAELPPKHSPNRLHLSTVIHAYPHWFYHEPVPGEKHNGLVGLRQWKKQQ